MKTEVNKDFVLKTFNDSMEKLKYRKSLFEQIEENPEIVLTQLFDRNKYSPHYDLHMQIFGRSNTGERDISYGDIQIYLLNVLKQYFREIDNETDVVISSKSYPTTFKLVYLDKPIISFNIYKGYFGDFRSNRFKNGLDGELKYLHEDIEELENEIKLHKSHLKHPSKMFRKSLLGKTVDFFIYYKNKKKVVDNLSKRIERLEKFIVDNKEQIERIKKEYETYLSEKDLTEDKFQGWRQRFLDWGFEEKEKRSHELY